MPNASVFQRRSDLTIPDPIAIDLSFGREPGVKRLCHKLASHDSDLRWQNTVQGRRPPLSRITAKRKVRMRNLRQSMDPGISSPSPMDSHARRRNVLERVFQVVLD